MSEFDYWHFAAGLALFIFGMMRVEDSLKELAGRPFKKFLQHQTKNPVKAVLAGTGVTAVLQSSSVVLLMVLSFVGAGIMEMRNALAVVMGSNLGTTLDSWVVAIFGFRVEIERLSYPILAIALVGFIFFRNRSRIRHISEFLVGFSLLFLGLAWMKQSATGLADPSILQNITSRSPYLFIPIGFLFTVIIQSSSATMAIALTTLHSGLIPLEHAAAMVIGSELGTGVKIILGAVGGIPDKKRVALGNFYFNGVTLILAAIILFPLLDLIALLFGETDPLIKLVIFQTTINFLSILIFLPFLKRFAEFLEKKYSKSDEQGLSLFIHRTAHYPGKQAIELAELEIRSLLQHAFNLNRYGMSIVQGSAGEEKWYTNFKKIALSEVIFDEQYQKIKLLQGDILEYIQEIQQDKFNIEQISRLNELVFVCREIIHAVKNIKDIRHNLNDLADSAHDNLFELFTELQSRQKLLYENLETTLDSVKEKILIKNVIHQYLEKNKEEQEQAMSQLFLYLREDKISEIKVSTMLNVYREIYSSNKSFILAISELLKLSEDE